MVFSDNIMYSKRSAILYIVNFTDISVVAVAKMVCINLEVWIGGYCRIILYWRLGVRFGDNAETDIDFWHTEDLKEKAYTFI